MQANIKEDANKGCKWAKYKSNSKPSCSKRKLIRNSMATGHLKKLPARGVPNNFNVQKRNLGKKPNRIRAVHSDTWFNNQHAFIQRLPVKLECDPTIPAAPLMCW